MRESTEDHSIRGHDRYEDRGRLGLGASADVRRVYDRRLKRTVAMKVVRMDRIDDQRVARRLIREATLGGNLQHAGIPAVYDRDLLADGRPFFTMRMVPGASLMDETIRFHRRVGPGGPGGKEALRRLVVRILEVADAVASAHRNEILHRDLKLANVMAPDSDVAQVVDWGLAVDLTTPPERPGRAGTRGYMPPEQEVGSPRALAPTADVYAMGEMLARVLFGAGHAAGKPSHPAHAPPAPYAHVCAKARAHDPAERYADAEHFRDGLAKAIDRASVRIDRRYTDRSRLAG